MKRKTKKETRAKYAKAKTPPVRRECGTMIVHSRLLERDPTFCQRLVNLEQLTSRRMLAGLPHPARGPATIPLVVAVMCNTAGESISKENSKTSADRRTN